MKTYKQYRNSKPSKPNQEKCIRCFRWLPKSRMRTVFGGWWKCNPKGGYKNAIECLHLDYDQIYGIGDYHKHGGSLNWIKPKDRKSFGWKEIEKADRWLLEGEISEEDHKKTVWYVREEIALVEKEMQEDSQ